MEEQIVQVGCCAEIRNWRCYCWSKKKTSKQKNITAILLKKISFGLKIFFSEMCVFFFQINTCISLCIYTYTCFNACMCVMCVCMYINTCLPIYRHVCLLIYYLDEYIDIAYMETHLHACIHTCMHKFIHIEIHMCNMCIYMPTYTHICWCMIAYIQLYMHKNMHTIHIIILYKLSKKAAGFIVLLSGFYMVHIGCWVIFLLFYRLLCLPLPI